MDAKKSKQPKNVAVTLRTVAAQVGLAPGTVSAVLNNAPASRVIPERTKKRILEAARELNYRPNFFAQSLRSKRTYTIGVILEEIGDAYGSMIISGIELYLRQKNFFFLTVAHRHDANLLGRYAQILMERGVEGLITVDLQLTEAPSVPTVAVAGHRTLRGVTNIVLNHHHAARIALEHLLEMGHRKIAFLKGQTYSSDSEDRWKAICEVAGQLELEINPELVVQIDIDDSTPKVGYPFGKQLLARGIPFTALFAYNDISAMGAIRAFQEEGVVVPKDISVVGFDDIQGAAFNTPSLTTVRQPLIQMGAIAAETLLDRIAGRGDYPTEIAVEPELVIRESTARVCTIVNP